MKRRRRKAKEGEGRRGGRVVGGGEGSGIRSLCFAIWIISSLPTLLTHSVTLATPRLPVREDSGVEAGHEGGDERFDGRCIEFRLHCGGGVDGGELVGGGGGGYLGGVWVRKEVRCGGVGGLEGGADADDDGDGLGDGRRDWGGAG